MADGVMNLRDFTAVNTPERVIINLLQEAKPLFKNLPSMEANRPTSHVTGLITSLPTTSVKVINDGVAPSKPTTKDAEFDMASFQTRIKYDSDIDLIGQVTAKVKMNNVMAATESLGQKAEQTVFYGNSLVNAGEFTGLAYYYDSLQSTAVTSRNVISCGGTTANKQTSMYLVGAGEYAAHLIHPKGVPAGIKRKDLGIQTETDAAGKQIDYKIEKWSLVTGLVLNDWRTCGRICNIDMTATGALFAEDANGAASVVNAIATRANVLLNRIKGNYGSLAFYCHPDVIAMLGNQALNRGNAAITFQQDAEGKRKPYLWGIPLYASDSILATEAIVA